MGAKSWLRTRANLLEIPFLPINDQKPHQSPITPRRRCRDGSSLREVGTSPRCHRSQTVRRHDAAAPKQSHCYTVHSTHCETLVDGSWTLMDGSWTLMSAYAAVQSVTVRRRTRRARTRCDQRPRSTHPMSELHRLSTAWRRGQLVGGGDGAKSTEAQTFEKLNKMEDVVGPLLEYMVRASLLRTACSIPKCIFPHSNFSPYSSSFLENSLLTPEPSAYFSRPCLPLALAHEPNHVVRLHAAQHSPSSSLVVNGAGRSLCLGPAAAAAG